MVLTARRQGLLEDLRDELLARYEDIDIHVAKLDVSDTSTVLNMPETLPAGFRDVSLLLNNAGLAAGFGSVSEYNMEDLSTMMDVNVKGLGACCRAFVPGMKKRGRGHVINISSIAGKAAYPNGAFYCASKYAVEAITASLRAELVATPIRVTSVSPGWVNEGTEFSKVRFNGDAARATALYEGLDALTADDVADAIAYAATRPPHVQVADIYLLPTNQAHPFEGGLHRSKL